LHELCHLHFINDSHLKLIKEVIVSNKIKPKTNFFKEKMSPMTIINETIIESLVPKGYIGIKYLHAFSKKIKVKSVNNFLDFRQIALRETTPLSEEYITNNKHLDKKFINEIAKILKSTKKER